MKTRTHPKRLSSHARGYGHRWQRLRKIILTEEPLCRMCKAQGRTREATVVDHITPKRDGGTDERENLQALCFTCHNSTKHSAEMGGRQKGCDTNGVPLDPNHHWN